MKKHLPLLLALCCLTTGLLAQQRPVSEIAADLEKLVAELRSQKPQAIVVPVGGNLASVLATAPAGAQVELSDADYVCNCARSQPLTLSGPGRILTANGSPALTISGDDVVVRDLTVTSATGASTNDLVIITGARTVLDHVMVIGNGATKRGIAANGRDMTFVSIQVQNIGRVGQESQAVAIWDGTGLTIRKSFLEAGSTPFLSGGSAPTIANHVPENILIEDSTLSHPLAWRGKGYVNKTGFELKSARHVIVRGTKPGLMVIENVWVEGQTAYGITLTPSQYGNSPETIVEDVLFDTVTVRNVGGGANIIGYSQHQTATPPRPTQRLNNVTVRNSIFNISRAEYGGHGSLMQLGIEPSGLHWQGNTVTMDGDAFIRTTDSRPIPDFTFTGNTVARAGTYGIWTPSGSRGGAWVSVVFPGLVLTGNTFTGAHATFRAAFPNNTWVAGS